MRIVSFLLDQRAFHPTRIYINTYTAYSRNIEFVLNSSREVALRVQSIEHDRYTSESQWTLATDSNFAWQGARRARPFRARPTRTSSSCRTWGCRRYPASRAARARWAWQAPPAAPAGGTRPNRRPASSLRASGLRGRPAMAPMPRAPGSGTGTPDSPNRR